MVEFACCFTGHRVLSPNEEKSIEPILAQCVRALAGRGVTDFLCGGAVGFDRMAAQAVLSLRTLQGGVRLILVQPCRGQDRYYTKEERVHYQTILSAADEVVCLAEHYYRGCMHVRNRYMVDHASCVVAYCTRQTGGAYYTVRYAEQTNKPVEYLRPMTSE